MSPFAVTSAEIPASMLDTNDVAGRMPLVLSWLAIVGVAALAAIGSAARSISRQQAGRGWSLFVRSVLIAAAILAIVDGGLQAAAGAGMMGGLATSIGILLTIALTWIPLPTDTRRSMVLAVVLTLVCGAACVRLRGLTAPATYAEFTFVEPSVEYEDTVTGAHALTDDGQMIRLGRFVLAEPKPLIPEGFDGRVIVADATNSRANCHGWVFTGGAYRVMSEDVDAILHDNGYRTISEPGPNDLIIYRDDAGRVVHTGVVKAVGPGGFTLIESKWGPLDVYWHTPDNQIYSQRYDYYRSPRESHLLRIETPASDADTTR